MGDQPDHHGPWGRSHRRGRDYHKGGFNRDFNYEDEAAPVGHRKTDVDRSDEH